MSESAWESPVKKRLRDGEPVIAVTITTANVDVAAHAAGMGFDFLWIETEHSPITLETLRNMVLATRGMKALPFARDGRVLRLDPQDRKSTRLNSSHANISYAVFC